jgi:YVTN family beta-propeller protein
MATIQKKYLYVAIITAILLTIAVAVMTARQARAQTSLEPIERETELIKMTGGSLRGDVIAINPNTNIAYVVFDSYNYSNSFVSAIDESKRMAVNNIFSPRTEFVDIKGLAVNPNTNRIYVVTTNEDDEGIIYILNATTNKEIDRISLGQQKEEEVEDISPSDIVNRVAVNQNTDKLYVAASDHIDVIDGSTKKIVDNIQLGYNTQNIAINPNTNTIYIVTYRGLYDEETDSSSDLTKLFVIDGRTNSVIKEIPVEESAFISSITVDITTNKVYATADSNRILVIDGRSNDILTTLIVENSSPYSRGIAVNSNLVYVTNYDKDSISVVDGSIGRIGNKPIADRPTAVAVNPNTNRVYVAHPASNTISMTDGSSSSLYQLDESKIPGIRVHGIPTAVAVNPNTNRVYVASSEADTISIIDESSDKVASTLPLNNGSPAAVAVNPNTNRVYVETEYSPIDANNDTPFINITIFDGMTEKAIDNITGLGGSFSLFGPPIGVVVDPESENIYVIETKEELPTELPTPMFYEIDSKTNKLIPYNASSELQEVLSSDTLGSVSPIAVSGVVYGLTDIYGDLLSVQLDPSNKTVSIADRVVLEEPSFGNAIAVNPATKMVYIADYLTNTVYVIDPYIDKVINSIPVENNPTALTINPDTNIVYAANEGSNTVSVIDGWHNKVIKNITVEDSPTAVAVNPNTNRVYVASSESDALSVIDGSLNQVVVGVEFSMNPSNGGRIECENKEFPTNEYRRIGVDSVCKAKANEGFYFTGWIQNLGNNSTRSLTTTPATISYSSFNQLLSLLGFRSSDDNSATLDMQQYHGNFTANFKEIPPPVPPEFWIPLYGIIVSTIVGWSIPSIIGWARSKGDVRKLNYYHKQITSLYGDGKLDEKDIEPLNRLRTSIVDAYSKGKINEKHYESLKDEISILYDKIFRKRINDVRVDASEKATIEELNKVRTDLEYSYSEGKINEKHYNLLIKDILDFESKESY